MKIFSTLALSLLCCAATVLAQTPVFYPSNYQKVLGKSGTDTLENAFTGGMNHPIFGNVDLNMDGRQDLVILDRTTIAIGTVLPFLSVRRGNEYRFVYAPQYAHLFPLVKGWGIFADYNFDGKNDLFLYSEPFGVTGSVTAFENVGTDSVRFEMRRKQLGKYSKSSSGFDRISVNMSEIPTFSDMDGDGDLDMIVFNYFSSSAMDYFKNISKDSSWNLDSLKFAYVDQCWGRIGETGTPGELQYFDCSQYLTYHPRSERMHSGSAITAIDIDGDGDKELLIGDTEYPYLLLAVNDRKGTSKIWDTIGSYKPSFPNANPVKVKDCPLASLVDVNADGKTDLLASPMIEMDADRKNISWYYQNIAAGSAPNFEFKDSSFLEKTMLDQGENSVPCFLDYDGDGLTDLLLAVLSQNGHGTDQVYYYRNTGSATRPVFKLASNDFLGLGTSLFNNLTLTLGDLNNDGKKDLVMGSGTGEIYYLLNQSSGGGFQFPSSGSYLDEDISGSPTRLDVGNNSYPAMGDINGDGKEDLLIGRSSGKISYFENVTTGSTPLFKKVTDDFGSITVLKEAAPCLGLIDSDDSLDLLVGSYDQPVRFYRNISASGITSGSVTNLFYNFDKTKIGTVTTQRCVPALAHLDQDNAIDIALGTSRGGLLIYTSVNNNYTLPEAGLVDPKKPEQLKIGVYPNPTRGRVVVSLEDIAHSQKAVLTLTDMLGRPVSQAEFTAARGDSRTEMEVAGFAAGVYTLRITLPGEGRFATRQLIITR
jgi:hypothetical protein